MGSTENTSSGESNNYDSLEVVSSAGDATRELESAAENLTRVELDLARSSEKLCNLDILVMHVASRENDFEAFGSEEEGGPVERALEFDLLYGFLDSQVRELEFFLSTLQNEITSSHELISSFKQLGYVLRELEEKFQDCENSLKWSFEHVSDIKTQSANFQRIFSDLNAKIKMQTAEQQRDILRMLEKSLAREMDLEKKLSESRQNDEDLKFRLQQQVYCMEEEAEEMWERLFEAENSAEILLAISKELSGRLQTAQYSINGSTQKIQDLSEQLKEKDCALQVSESSLREFETKAAEAEKRAEVVVAECKSLRESSVELNKDLNCLKSSIADKTGTVEQLERQLKESELKRMHAVATAEASQEKESMLDCTIKDMENLIKDLKSKIVKAESQTESAEEKCIILSETNAELGEEINFLRRRTEHLETSLHQAHEAKKETAKDIRVRTKLITDLVVQLALERERLRKQISLLTKENKVAVKYLQRIKEPSVTVIGSHDAKAKEIMFMENDSKNGLSRKESNEKLTVSSVTSYEIGNEHSDSSTTEIKTSDADTTSELNTEVVKCIYHFRSMYNIAEKLRKTRKHEKRLLVGMKWRVRCELNSVFNSIVETLVLYKLLAVRGSRNY
ncbi:WPP domain-interacting tail-anchored protein 1 [Phtheirospermum japonicum]|uniref:WPP domain-interacting tail-anchored protein 1 n=1 Tax=Phtheirospermum japonicum TaxID=374723 RepID=A0A830BY67_9LAMI|nr:WPP domain-interacting tail-anchored protein 1 [Phtheirospermum japonicum]